MTNPAEIGKNTLEDFNDELITGITYKYANKMFKPLEDSLTSDEDSVLNEALEGALSTLKFSIMNAVIISVTNYASVKLIQASGIIFAYVKTGRITKVLRNLSERLKTLPMVGRVSSRVVRFGIDAVVGDQKERIAIANMANNNVNNLASIVSKERHNQILIKKSGLDHFDNNLKTNQGYVKEKYNQKRSLFDSKFRSASWTISTDDKQLYQDVTGYNFSIKPQKFNQEFVDKLNSVSDVATDVEGNIINASQAHVDYITTLGYQKVK
jgi:hypothetical protein